MGRQLALGVVAAMVLVGCEDESDLPPILMTGQHVRYGTTADVEVCPGTIAYLDQFVEDVYAYLEEPVPPGPFLTYYWLPGAMDLAPCASGSMGHCSRIEGDQTSVYAGLQANRTAVAGGVSLEALGPGRHFLKAGFEQMLGEQGDLRYTWPDAVDVDALLVDEPTSGFFTGSWHLVFWMLERHAVADFKQFWMLAGTDDSSDTSETRALFEDVFGESIDDHLATTADQPICPTILCGTEPKSWLADVWATAPPTGCEDPDAVGPMRVDVPTLFKYDTVEVSETGMYSATLVGSKEAELSRCDRLCEGGTDAFRVNEGPNEFQLQDGRYQVVTIQASGTDAPASLELRAVPP